MKSSGLIIVLILFMIEKKNNMIMNNILLCQMFYLIIFKRSTLKYNYEPQLSHSFIVVGSIVNLIAFDDGLLLK